MSFSDQLLVATVLATFTVASGISSFLVKHQESRMKREAHEHHDYFHEDVERAEMVSLEIGSAISSRFAETVIVCEMLNNYSGDKEAKFEVLLPVAAFISNFTMEVDGNLLVGKVMSHADASKVYKEATNNGETAGLVSSLTNPEQGIEYDNKFPFSMTTSVRGQSSAVFTLTYQELLRRSNGRYRHDINVKPLKVLDSLEIKITVNEPQGIQFFDIEEPSGSSFSVVKEEINSREVVYKPSPQNQEAINAELGLNGDFSVSYDTQHSSTAGEVLTEDEVFAHFFSPDANNELTTITKKIVFVIDISGSMEGVKIQQTAAAMETILDQLRETDIFMFILFEATQNSWPSSQLPIKATAANIVAAKAYLTQNLLANGGTNINDALLDATQYIKATVDQVGVSMVIFLTDGDATVGETKPENIIDNVVAACGSKISVYSVSIGASLNFDFLKKLSVRTNGIPYRIDTIFDITEKLEDFFSQIDDPLLTDVLFEYDEDIVAIDSITNAGFPRVFNGSEVIVAGELKTTDGIQANVTGITETGQVTLQNPVIRDVSEIDQIQRGFLRKLYIYLKIHDLFQNRTIQTDSEALKEIERQATELAIENNLVTPLTSVVVYETIPTSIQRSFSHSMHGGFNDLFTNSTAPNFEVSSTALLITTSLCFSLSLQHLF